jgi:hypothetical protein
VNEALLDERGEPFCGDVDYVRLPSVERCDDVLDHVDQEDATAGLGERGRERHAHIARADHADVIASALSHGRQG